VLLPAGAVETDEFGSGWKARGRGFRYYNSRAFHSDQCLDGLTRFVVTVNTHGELRLRMKAKGGTFPVDPARLPLRLTVVFTPRSTTGRCGEIAFAPPQCQFEPAAGGWVSCK